MPAADLEAAGRNDLANVHVMDATGKEVLCQAVDNNGDGTPDQLIFQADFAAGETLTFTAVSGEKRVYTKEQFRAYGRSEPRMRGQRAVGLGPTLGFAQLRGLHSPVEVTVP